MDDRASSISATMTPDLGGTLWRGLTGPIITTLEKQAWYNWPYWHEALIGFGIFLILLIMFWFWRNFIR